MKYRILDMFCGAGGAGMGYHRAGFEVVGVDIAFQKHYPFEFHQGDALEYIVEHGYEFDAIHASPPCQAYTGMKARWVKTTDYIERHIDLIPDTRAALIASGKPYVIENVIGAPLYISLMLCGTMFGLQTEAGNQLLRHRIFETSFWIMQPGTCQHNTGSAIGVYGGGQNPARKNPVGVYGHTGEKSTRTGETQFCMDARCQVMDIDWMTQAELSQAIPPAYTEYIGKQLMQILEAT
jgi:DNA (cytosine-5)-methyltransferase 1